MLESGLFFALGFLCAALLALMVAPAIWRRAVVLTRQRIESAVPLTLNEIQADKDQLRAEFAMSTRRLEVSLEDLKGRAAEQLIEINRRRDEVLELETRQSEKERRIADLEAQAGELRTELMEREERLSKTNSRLLTVESRLEEKALAFEDLNERYRTVVDDFDGQKIEMVARETKLETVQDEARDIQRILNDRDKEIKKQATDMKRIERESQKEHERYEQLEQRFQRLQTKHADVEARLERRDADLARMRANSGETGERVGELERELDLALAEKVKLQAEIAQNAQRMGALLQDASDENIENAIATFETEQRELREQLRTAESERDSLQVELSAMQMASGDDWETERRENAIVRERINDLAAQVTAVTAALEGPDSPIEKALSKPVPVKDRAKNDVDKAVDDVTSLADRIRALQTDGADTSAAGS